MQPAKEGVAYLASRSGAPVIPVAVEGTEGYPSLSRRTPGAVVRLGRPFRFRTAGQRPGREDLHRMTDEAMYVLAAMLPEARRGVYSDLTKATCETLEFA